MPLKHSIKIYLVSHSTDIIAQFLKVTQLKNSANSGSIMKFSRLEFSVSFFFYAMAPYNGTVIHVLHPSGWPPSD